jgi:two-component system alkaline phosphatase synthesis response regulator PhoP|tara:strand:+ start:8551 stop:9249 length:699 start_codon:yes stop_codon:yes gene_type:complete
MTQQTSVLIIEDEENISEAIQYNLRQNGYQVLAAEDGLKGLGIIENNRVDLLILDIMLPGMDGLDVCKEIRKTSNMPIIMLTAKIEESNKVVGLELGADDYVTKPFSMSELLARVKSLLRRSNMNSTSDNEQSNILESGDLLVDLNKHIATIEKTPLDLRPKQFDLLTFFLRNKGKALSRDQILENLWGYDYIGDVRTVDVHVRWLREIIEKDSRKPNRIITVRGFGYRFDQ